MRAVALPVTRFVIENPSINQFDAVTIDATPTLYVVKLSGTLS